MKSLKQILTIFFCLLLIFQITWAETPNPAELISKMTLEEKAKLVVGMGMNFPGMSLPPSNEPAVGQILDKVAGAAGSTYAVPRLSIPSIVVGDGPAGLRITPFRENDSTKTYYATAFPIASLLASSWDTTLVKNVGNAIGNEVLEYGVDVILMPALNLHRNPLCGRNFEYYSEDPLVSGLMAAAMVKGVQANGVGTSIKHYVANNQEANRMAVNAKVSERAMRELYLKGFEIAVKQSSPWTVMSSYNKVNGIYTSENPYYITEILRGDWGFEGFVMTDWFGGKDPVAQMKAGNDLLMPGTKPQTEKIIEAVNEGSLDEKILDRNVEMILNIVFKSPVSKDYKYSDKPDLKAHAKVARQAAAEGMVLLRNESQTLPINKAKNIALFGNASYELITGGTGSGDVNEAYTISMEQALTDAGFVVNEKIQSTFKTYIKKAKAARPKQQNWFMPVAPIAEMAPEKQLLYEMARETDIALLTIGRNSGEFEDRKLDDFNMSETEQNLIADVSAEFHAFGKKVVVVLNIGGVIEMASWRDKVDAILLAWQPGQEGGHPIVDVLSGAINPSGKLPMTFPIRYEDVPSASFFPGVPAEKPDSVEYKEDFFVGYRHYCTKDVKTAYEFGYGLSYTTFDISKLKLDSKTLKEKITASVIVKNTGSVAGKQVVQLYIKAPQNSMVKPVYELKEFAKTGLLKPGESQTIKFDITADDLVSFDEANENWLAEKGKYTIHAGFSATDFQQEKSFKLKRDVTIKK